jgi:hypothetical protein
MLVSFVSGNPALSPLIVSIKLRLGLDVGDQFERLIIDLFLKLYKKKPPQLAMLIAHHVLKLANFDFCG